MAKKPKPEDRDNFEFTLDGFHIVMDNGELTVNDASYERDNPDDPSYALVRAYWEMRAFAQANTIGP